MALSYLVGCASPAFIKPHKCAVWVHFPCTSRAEIFLTETFHSSLHSAVQMLYSEHDAAFRYYKVHYFVYLSQTVEVGEKRPNAEEKQNLIINKFF